MITIIMMVIIMDFRGLDSSSILNLRAGAHRPIGNFLEKLESTNLGSEMFGMETGRI